MEIFQLVRSQRGNQDFVKWIGRFTVQKKRLQESWMDLLPVWTKLSPECLSDVANQNLANQAGAGGQQRPAVNPQSEDTFNEWKGRQVASHKTKFPLGDNLYTLILSSSVISRNHNGRDSRAL